MNHLDDQESNFQNLLSQANAEIEFRVRMESRIEKWIDKHTADADDQHDLLIFIWASKFEKRRRYRRYIRDLEIESAAYRDLAVLIRAKHFEAATKLIATVEMIPKLLEKKLSEGVLAGKSIAPRMGASKRHAETNSMRQEMFVWLDANFDPKSKMTLIARQMLKQVKIEEKTALKWINLWKKNKKTFNPNT